MSGTDIVKQPIHLGRGATAAIEPAFTGNMEWYQGYSARYVDDGEEGRLVSMYTFTESWGMWEMHPHGSEVVLCTSGALTLHQENAEGVRRTVLLRPGEYAINEAGTWHTADVAGTVTAVFITSGLDTQHRPR
jgi:mannose-6-phosphate isomerase-like protein (cupin superfamily)